MDILWQKVLALFGGGFLLWVLFWRKLRGGSQVTFKRRLLGAACEGQVYNLADGKAVPAIPGKFGNFALRIFTSAFGRCFLLPLLVRDARCDIFRDILISDPPTYYPLLPWNWKGKGHQQEVQVDLDLDGLLSKSDKGEKQDFRFHGISDFYHGYRSGKFTPSQVAENAIAAIEMSNSMKPSFRAFIELRSDLIRMQAQQSTERFARDAPLSVLDGIPVGIKDEISVKSHHLRMGCNFVGHTVRDSDAEVVRRLREKGAIILGMTNMQENGMGTTGINSSKYHGTPRNPYNVDHFTGGSSSGSGSSVGAGLCPVALGTDGGGSVRIPATFCGVVGLKPTFGRVSSHGCEVNGFSVCSVGPLCTNVTDTAIVYAAMAGPHADSMELAKMVPKEDLAGFDAGDLEGLTVGVDWCMFRHADAEIVSTCEKAVRYLESRGAEVVDIQVPELDEARIAHVIIILSEMRNGLHEEFVNHLGDQYFENALLLSAVNKLTVNDFIQACRQRTRSINMLKEIFQEVDVILSPGNAVLAPKINPAYLKHGFSDTALTVDIVRSVFLANLTGIPAMVVPVGYSSKGLPISLQIAGSWWEENRVLRVAKIAEEFLVQKKKPAVYFDLLQ